MTMYDYVKLDTFILPNDTHDWKAYRAAQIANGEYCSQCGCMVHGKLPSGAPRLCSDCERATSSRSALLHASRVRCPACGWLQSPPEEIELHRDTVGIYCDKCEHEYEVGIVVTVEYRSPGMVDA